MFQGVSGLRFLGGKISFIRWTDMFEGEKPTAEKLFGIQDLLQAECFPAESEKRALLPNENSDLITSLHLLKNNKNIFILCCFSCQEAPVFQNKRDTCLSAFQVIYFVERTILSNMESMRALSHLHKYIFY